MQSVPSFRVPRCLMCGCHSPDQFRVLRCNLVGELCDEANSLFIKPPKKEFSVRACQDFGEKTDPDKKKRNSPGMTKEVASEWKDCCARASNNVRLYVGVLYPRPEGVACWASGTVLAHHN